MFAGIVRGRGRITVVEDAGGDRTVSVSLGALGLGPLPAGASVAINGVCLTALEAVGDVFRADVSRETLAVTTLGSLRVGDPVNVETSLRLGDPVDGHLVYGHVDGVGVVTLLEPEARSWRLGIQTPVALGRYIAAKGSVAVDGVSLTVNRTGTAGFEVNVIPHTREVTIIGGYAVGTTVNIEVDMMARYMERLAAHESPAITVETLRQHGFTGDD